MTDITSSFLQQVSAAQKYEGISGTNILRPIQKKLPFVVTAEEISKNIKGLHSFLTEHKAAYLDSSSKYISSSNFMTEDERDDIDNEAVATLEKCKKGISTLQLHLVELKKKRTADGDMMSHLIGIVDILQKNLMDTATTFKTFKKERLKKKMQEAEGYFKLDTIKKNPLSPLTRRGGNYVPSLTVPGSFDSKRQRSTSTNNNNNNNNNTTSPSTSPTFSDLTEKRNRSNSGSNHALNNKGKSSSSTNLNLNASNESSRSSSSTPTSPVSLHNPTSPVESASPSITPPLTPTPNTTLLVNRTASWLAKNSKDFNSSAELLESELKGGMSDEEDLLDASEKHALETENAALQREFDTMVDQVRSIDQKLVEVAGLFDELTEHAITQKDTMEIISDLTESSITMTKHGVSELATATSRTVDFRLMVLLFLITCTVSLLFLHWYED